MLYKDKHHLLKVEVQSSPHPLGWHYDLIDMYG